eukprot:356122-Ditylum_brightwellii.AAC.1
MWCHPCLGHHHPQLGTGCSGCNSPGGDFGPETAQERKEEREDDTALGAAAESKGFQTQPDTTAA